ncbi:protein SFI1 homolog isoform X1 [Acanthopagrus latus]|uniref:protein SFI1 homolog isoform X1 n=1 Tax=Acanthopagrus latus TaxID=8177 RepID=UPI00187CB83C|nr:protein SFI1 homolog isoform X1 [Acanthopagrus latus]
MQSNVRKPDQVRPRPSSVSSGDGTKQARRFHTRKVPYKVGYSWNKGGRLKELRIRHLARKFLKIWIHNTFGRILLHEARSHYRSMVLRRAFGGWRDEWWTSRREWSLTMRAECHYRYYLYNLAFQRWRLFVSLQMEKRSKIQHAELFADRQRMRLALDGWEVFTEMRQMKNRMLESALELNRLTTLHSVWRLWRSRLQQYQDLYTLQDQVLNQRALTLQSRTWFQWKKMHTAACCQREKETKAALLFTHLLKRKALHRWKSYVSCVQTKKNSQAVAQRAFHLHLLTMCWSKWSSALHHKQSKEDRLRAAGYLAIQSTQRRALERWRAYVTLCREEDERNRIARQHHHHHLLRAGLQGLSVNIDWNKTHRLNNNMAVQHHHQTMTSTFWKLWQDRLEEAEDKRFQPLGDMALAKHSSSLLSCCFHHWREMLAERRHTKELEHRADVWFAERMLPRCFNSWIKFTLQRRLHEQRRHKAEFFNQQRQHTWVFYTWWGRSETQKEQMLSERMAILHEERSHLQRAWCRWRQQTEQQISEEEKQTASDSLYLHRLLHKTMTQWKDNSTEIRDRRNREQQACHQGDLCCMRWALAKWKQFVQSQRVKKSRLEQMKSYHEVKLLNHTLGAWKTHHLQVSQIYDHAEELHRQQEQNYLRKVLCVWREKAALLTEVRLMERQAQNHFQHFLQLKVFLAWREAATYAVLRRHQQGEAVVRAQRSINQVHLLQSFRRWRKQTREARRERIYMEKARRYHESRLLSKAVEAWNRRRSQNRRKKIMKRQGIILLRLKMYQKYFELWQVKLQHRRREAEQMECALWHWSLTLQAKVLFGWRLWVTEQRRKQEQAARAAQVYRDQLLREGVTCILTYAAHMNDITTSLTQHSQEQRLRHLQRVVRRCAMRWKQRALCKPQRERAVKVQHPKKSVTFCLTTPGSKAVPSSESVEQEDEDEVLTKLIKNQLAFTGTEAAPKHLQLSHHTVSTMGSPQEKQDVLLPPSAFMTTALEDTLRKSSSSSFGDPLLMPPFGQHTSAHSDEHLRTSSAETEGTDPTSALIRELLSIQMDMKTYQQDRKQLRAWQKLKEVLQSWLQTSGQDEQMEKDSVCQELEELEERIVNLSTELAKRKPTMLLHAERIEHLQTVLIDHSAQATLQQIVLTHGKSEDTC